MQVELLAAAIFAVISGQPQYWYERCPETHGVTVKCETKEERDKRLRAPSLAMAKASVERVGGFEPLWIAAGLITKGRNETNWARYVHEGCVEFPHPEAPRCDPLRTRKGMIPMSLTFWQLQARACVRVHQLKNNPAAQLDEAARCAAQQFAGAYGRCKGQNPKGDIAGAFAGYAGQPGGCRWLGKFREKSKVYEVEARASEFVVTHSRLRLELDRARMRARKRKAEP